MSPLQHIWKKEIRKLQALLLLAAKPQKSCNFSLIDTWITCSYNTCGHILPTATQIASIVLFHTLICHVPFKSHHVKSPGHVPQSNSDSLALLTTLTSHLLVLLLLRVKKLRLNFHVVTSYGHEKKKMSLIAYAFWIFFWSFLLWS